MDLVTVTLHTHISHLLIMQTKHDPYYIRVVDSCHHMFMSFYEAPLFRCAWSVTKMPSTIAKHNVNSTYTYWHK